MNVEIFALCKYASYRDQSLCILHPFENWTVASPRRAFEAVGVIKLRFADAKNMPKVSRERLAMCLDALNGHWIVAQVVYKASVASRVLDQAAEKDLPALPHSPEERLRRFRTWVATVPARPGPPVDTRRETIYD